MADKKILFNDLGLDIKRFKPELEKVFSKVIDSGWFILGQEVRAFEEEFAGFLNVKHIIGVANGQEALQISLMALGIGKEDEVITTPLSAVASTLAILAVGAKSVFVDTDEFGNIDVNLIEKAISKKTKAILPVHLYGQAVDLGILKRICKTHKLFLVEDACQAHGSTFKGKKLGTVGDINAFSFYPTKNLAAIGDGGAITTNNSKLAKIAREIRDYGQTKKYWHSRYGLNSRLDELQAALLRVKLKSLEADNKKRQLIAAKYIEGLRNIKGVEIVLNGELLDNNFHLFVIRVKKRDQLQKYLAEKNIQTLIHYPNLIPDQPFLKKDFGKTNLPVARKFVKEILSLPIYPSMDLGEVDIICREIKSFFTNRS